MHWLALFHFVMGKVVHGNEPATFLHGCGEFAGKRAVVEIVGIRRNPLQSSREIRLPENFTGLVVIAVALKHPPRLRKLRQIRIVHIGGLAPSQRKSITR